MYDWLVVGAGFAGSVLAERLASQRGERVLVIDRRPHIGGNAYDRHDEAGVLIHRYGPHIFHTNAQAVVDYLSQFTEWRPYEHRVLAQVDGKLVPIPINLDTVNTLYGLDLDARGDGGVPRARGASRCQRYRHLGGRGRLDGGPRALREVLPRLHAQAVGRSTPRSSTSRSPRASRPAPTATTATSPTPSR